MNGLRAVWAVILLTLCNCLRAVIAGGVRLVRAVNAQVLDIVAGGDGHFAAWVRLMYYIHTGGGSLGVAHPRLEREGERGSGN